MSQEDVNVVVDFTNRVLGSSGLDLKAVGEDTDDGFRIQVRGDDVALLLGRNAELLDALAQRRPRDPEQLRRLHLIPVRLRQGARDQLALHRQHDLQLWVLLRERIQRPHRRVDPPRGEKAPADRRHLDVGLVVAYWQWILAIIVVVLVVKAAPVAWRTLQAEQATDRRRCRASSLERTNNTCGR